jgi:diguanylate cyclase (GGDEF)-like protein
MPQDAILLFDPFKNLINAYRMLLEGEKYLVETALSLQSAYHLVETSRYSVIITEYMPPFEMMDDMIQFVKENSPETYLIMVTNALIDEETYEKLFTLGIDDLISKPYSPQKILVHIKKGLKQRELILKKQELEKQAFPDLTTQQFFFNTIYFKKYVKQELKRAKRHQRPLSLLLIEIPEKGKMGQRFEDFCLELAKVIRKSIREEDMVGRHNGNLGILLPETDHIGSQVLVKRLDNLVQTHPMFHSDNVLMPIIKTLSFHSFTYPDEFGVPESLKAVVEEIDREYPQH